MTQQTIHLGIRSIVMQFMHSKNEVFNLFNNIMSTGSTKLSWGN